MPRSAARIGPERPKSDDEDYYYDDVTQGSGDGKDSDTGNEVEEQEEENKKVEDIMEDVGDADILICDNLVKKKCLSLNLYLIV